MADSQAVCIQDHTTCNKGTAAYSYGVSGHKYNNWSCIVGLSNTLPCTTATHAMNIPVMQLANTAPGTSQTFSPSLDIISKSLACETSELLIHNITAKSG